jgi:flavorubredoxin
VSRSGLDWSPGVPEGGAVVTRVAEIGEGVYRLSTWVSGIGGAAGFTFNQFLIEADEPLLFHCGQRPLFGSVAQAAARVIDPKRLRWIGYSHAEGDECGALNEWLAAAPNATPVHSGLGCALWLNDMADRAPRALGPEERLELGGRRVRFMPTPHVPHNVDAGLLYEETTATLFCSDLFTHGGDPPALTDGDILGPALATEKLFPFNPLTPDTAPTLRRLAALKPRTLAVMHGASFNGDVPALLEALAAHYDGLLWQERPA